MPVHFCKGGNKFLRMYMQREGLGVGMYAGAHLSCNNPAENGARGVEVHLDTQVSDKSTGNALERTPVSCMPFLLLFGPFWPFLASLGG
jgi:hypothetical protein